MMPSRTLRLIVGIALITALPANAALPTIVAGGITFGPQRHFSGVYFSNFENSKFIACDRAKGECKKWVNFEDQTLHCAPSACKDLERRIKRLVGSHDKWAVYKIDFLGRQSEFKTEKKFIGDTDYKVYLEQIELFGLFEVER